jgi:hypothetical protein
VKRKYMIFVGRDASTVGALKICGRVHVPN